MFDLKIHIVQKGDTLWEIAKNYGVDFDQVKQLNPQLSSPDMIMPGMKIKIPSTSKQVKKETMQMKETQKPKTQQPYKDTSPKPIPVVKEDDEKKPKSIQPKMPVQPKMQPMMQMPTMDQEMNNYTTINFPEMPPYPAPEEEPDKMQYMPMQQPMIPVYCCFCPPPPMHHAVPNAMGKKDCGCGGPQPMVSPMENNQMPMVGPMHSNQMPMVNPVENNQMPMVSPVQDNQMPMQSPMQYPNQYPYQGPMPTNNPYHHGNMESNEPPFGTKMSMKPAQSPQLNDYSPFDSQVPPQTMGAQQGFHSPNMPPQSHPYFANAANNNVQYPSPPGFDENSMFDFREDEDEDNSKSE